MGEEGWGKRGGARGGARGWNLYLNEVLNKTGIVTRLGCRNERYDTKLGNPRFSRDFPIVMTSRSRKYVIILPKKVRKRKGERFQLIIYARRSSHLENLNMWAHFEFSNSNISVFGHDFKPKMEISTDFSVI